MAMFTVFLWLIYGGDQQQAPYHDSASLPNTPHFMISGFLYVSMTPETNHDYLWIHQGTQNNSRKSQIIFENIIL